MHHHRFVAKTTYEFAASNPAQSSVVILAIKCSLQSSTRLKMLQGVDSSSRLMSLRGAAICATNGHRCCNNAEQVRAERLKSALVQIKAQCFNCPSARVASQNKIYIYVYMYICIYVYVYIYLSLLPFFHDSLSLSVSPSLSFFEAGFFGRRAQSAIGSAFSWLSPRETVQ